MVLLLFAVIGFLIGYRLGMSRAGYITLALTAVLSSAGQIIHLLMTQHRELVTMLPLVVGGILVLFMLVGAVVRLSRRSFKQAA
jgi:hypothetical protein